jgi:hypothetical protein
MSTPLCEVMQAAYFEGRRPGLSELHGYAAELRAIADAVVPHREFPDAADDIQKGIWLAQNRIRVRLLDEADAAER